MKPPAILPSCIILFLAAGPLPASAQANASGAAPLNAQEIIKICADHSVPAQACNLMNQWTPSTAASPVFDPLAHPGNSPKILSLALPPIVFEMTIVQGVRGEANTELEYALQLLSTNGAVTQLGGSATASGSTNLVTKPTTSDFISMASESGAFTDTLNGTTATIQANALGLTKYLNGMPVFARWDNKSADRLQPLNFIVTLNLAQTGSTVVPTDGPATTTTPSSIASLFLPSNDATLSSFGATYAVYRKFNPQSKAALKAWHDAVQANLATLQTDTVAMDTALTAFLGSNFDPIAFESTGTPSLATRFATWTAKATADDNIPDRAARLNALAADYKIYLDAYCHALLAPAGALANAQAFLASTTNFENFVYTVLDQARGQPLVTVGYTYTPSAQMPDTHNFTVSGGYTFKGKHPAATPAVIQAGTLVKAPQVNGFSLTGAQLSGNFTAAIFGNRTAGATYGLLEDVQGSGEFDIPFGGTMAQRLGTFSVAGYVQYQYNATVLNISSINELPGTNIPLPANAQTYLGTAGWLGVAQAKFVFNLKQGLSIPVAVKWSNKTDLLQGNDIRGQFGISYDFSALKSLIK
jgi:hypothetical protein